MKKFLFVCVLALASAPYAAAVSSCETRVDKNLDKSTAEKVQYCLTEENETADEGPVTEVIISDTYSVQYPKRKTAKTVEPTQQVTKIYSRKPVSMEYLERPDYPVFRNDTLPILNHKEANETALEALRGQSAQKETEKPAKRTKTSKPERKSSSVKKQAKANQTSPAQIQQAQALQNDPLQQDSTQGGTVPAGFLDDSVMGPANFGYNATDPALRP